MKVGDLVKIKHITGVGMVIRTEGPYFDVYLPASRKTVFCRTGELELINESR